MKSFSRVQHFVYGTPARLKRFRAALSPEAEVRTVPGGLVVCETVPSEPMSDAGGASIESLALASGLEYDGYGREAEAEDTGQGLDIQSQTFTQRTGVVAGHGFALPLPDGRFGHAIYLGGDRSGHLLIDISVLVTDRPSPPEEVREAARLYRQPILVWHTDFEALALPATVPLAQLPCSAVFRCGTGWPDPLEVARLEKRFAVDRTDTPEGWNRLLTAMAEAGERLPGTSAFYLMKALAGRTGILKLTQDHTLLQSAGDGRWPMPWQPTHISEVIAHLAGGPDMISARDKVT